MAKVFYEKDGITVTDTVFMNGKGNQYPIRNITSVEIKEKPTSSLLAFFGGFAIVVGVISIFSTDSIVQSLVTIAVGAGMYVVGSKSGRNSSTIELLIGGGGTAQTGMSLPLHDPSSKTTLDEISKAITESIAHLQKT